MITYVTSGRYRVSRIRYNFLRLAKLRYLILVGMYEGKLRKLVRIDIYKERQRHRFKYLPTTITIKE